ncbi:hypothetical protein M8C21_030924, partial [Ambrosia artemisiifolia]
VEDTDFSLFDGERSDASSSLVGSTAKQRDSALPTQNDFHTSRPKNTMVEAPIESRVVDGDKCSDTTVDTLEQEVLIDSGSESSQRMACVHIILNRSSIWCVAVTYYGVILLRKDDLALSAIVGSVSNVLLTFTLMQILNQERPVAKAEKKTVKYVGEPVTHLESIVSSMVCAAILVKSSVIICVTFGRAARLIAKYRPTMPVISVTIPRIKTIQLRWRFSGAIEIAEFRFELSSLYGSSTTLIQLKCEFTWIS